MKCCVGAVTKRDGMGFVVSVGFASNSKLDRLIALAGQRELSLAALTQQARIIKEMGDMENESSR